MRNGWREGRHLVVDDYSGRVYFSDEVMRTWDGLIVKRDGNEEERTRHPQDFVRAKKDPYPASPIRTRHSTHTVDFIDTNIVGSVTKPVGAGDHLYPTRSLYNISEMRILKDGTTRASAHVCAQAFIVR